MKNTNSEDKDDLNTSFSIYDTEDISKLSYRQQLLVTRYRENMDKINPRYAMINNIRNTADNKQEKKEDIKNSINNDNGEDNKVSDMTKEDVTNQHEEIKESVLENKVDSNILEKKVTENDGLDNVIENINLNNEISAIDIEINPITDKDSDINNIKVENEIIQAKQNIKTIENAVKENKEINMNKKVTDKIKDTVEKNKNKEITINELIEIKDKINLQVLINNKINKSDNCKRIKTEDASINNIPVATKVDNSPSECFCKTKIKEWSPFLVYLKSLNKHKHDLSKIITRLSAPCCCKKLATTFKYILNLVNKLN